LAYTGSALLGVIRYEFAMQARRVSLWIVSAVLGIIPLIQFNNTSTYTHDANLPITRADIVVVEAAGAATIFALGAGLILADRLRRDRTTRMQDRLRSAPVSQPVHLAGKYLGATLATLLPLTLLYIAGFACLVVHWGDASILPLALAGYVAFVLPAVLFVSAFSIACTSVLWPPLFQFLFVGYWLWDSLDPKGSIPTLDGTVLSPSGRLTMTGLFHFTPFRTTDLTYYPQASALLGLANIAALLGTATLVLLAAWAYQNWRANRE
jgi:ABC-2 type transport system permease protein